MSIKQRLAKLEQRQAANEAANYREIARQLCDNPLGSPALARLKYEHERGALSLADILARWPRLADELVNTTLVEWTPEVESVYQRLKAAWPSPVTRIKALVSQEVISVGDVRERWPDLAAEAFGQEGQ